MLSVITDFGCNKGCPYCIYKRMTPSTAEPPEDYYERLELAVRNVPGNAFSISGGGDPLHNFEDNHRFWSEVTQLCQKYNKRIDIHTAYLQEMIYALSDLSFIVRKAVIHCFPTSWEDDKSLLLALKECVPIRINFVIDHSLDTVATDIEEFCNRHTIPFSYRQLVEADLHAVCDETFYRTVGKRTQYGRYIEQDDYNIYFSPQGELKLKYMEI